MNTGGPALQIHALHEYLGHEQFEQLLVFGPSPQNEQELLDEAKIGQFLRMPQLQQGNPMLALPGSIVQVRKVIHDFQPDIVHTHTALAGLIGRVAALTVWGRPLLIHTFHGHLLRGYFGKGKVRLLRLVESLLALPSERLIAVGSRVQTELLNAGIGKASQFEVVPPGLELISVEQEWYPYERKGQITVGFFGRLERIKRPDRFLQVVAQVVADYPNVGFLVGGGGSLETWMRNEAGRRKLPIKFLGWVERPEEFFRQVDVLLMTSDNEGMPTSAIHAGMCGRPTVAPRVGSVDEVIDDCISGIVVEPDEKLLAGAVGEFVRSPDLIRRMGGHARQRTSLLFSADRLAADHQRIYVSALSRAGVA